MRNLQCFCLALLLITHAQCAVTCFGALPVSAAQGHVEKQSCHDPTESAPDQSSNETPTHALNDCAGSVTEAEARFNLKALTFDIALFHPDELTFIGIVVSAPSPQTETAPLDSSPVARPILRI